MRCEASRKVRSEVSDEVSDEVSCMGWDILHPKNMDGKLVIYTKRYG